MISFKCDRCHQAIPEMSNVIGVGYSVPSFPLKNIFGPFEVCDKCANEYMDAIMEVNKTVEE